MIFHSASKLSSGVLPEMSSRMQEEKTNSPVSIVYNMCASRFIS